MVAIATILLGGCAAPHATDSAQSAADAVDEYRAEQAKLVLADGWAWPADVVLADEGPDGAPVVYQDGYGTTRADRYWYCSWESAAVDPDSRENRAKILDELKSLRSTHLYNNDLLPPDKSHFDDILDTALGGDFSKMSQDVDLNCPDGRSSQSDPAG